MREKSIKKPADKMSDDLRPKYDLRQIIKGGDRGKHAKRYHSGTNLVLLDPSVRKSRPGGAVINPTNSQSESYDE